jgi:exodeoxyribonuclease V
MQLMKFKVVLLAPTGRAAKGACFLLQSHNAWTIHKKIYSQKHLTMTGRFVMDRNLHKDTLFIVDEASMISNQGFDSDIFGSGRLLDDLIQYVTTAGTAG